VIRRNRLRLPKCSVAVLCMAMALVAVGTAAGRPAAQTPQTTLTGQAPAARSVWQGVYTELQASRGERDYGRTCAKCHGLSLEGDAASEVPPLSADVLMRRWSGRTVQGLFELMSRSMPADAPGTLSPQRSAELVAYLLRANNLPSGETPLPSGPDALAGIAIEREAVGR
jgi:cytochrome c5